MPPVAVISIAPSVETQVVGSVLILVTVGLGLTVIVKVSGVPRQPFTVGVTVIDAVTAVVPEFTAVNVGISPFPLAARPMEGVSFVQANVPPDGMLVKFTAAVELPLQTDWFEMVATVGVGSTVIVKVDGVPGQPFNDGVTVMVAVTGADPELFAVKAAISPVPLAARPMDGVLFVQLNVPPTGLLVKLTAAVESPLQTVWFETEATVGVGLIVMVKVVATPAHPATLAMTEIVAEIGEVPPFVAVNAGKLPLPEAARPMAGLLFVHVKVAPVGVLVNAVAGTDTPLQ